MKKSSLLISNISILCIVLLISTSPLVSAGEVLHENEVWISGFEDTIGSEWMSFCKIIYSFGELCKLALTNS